MSKPDVIVPAPEMSKLEKQESEQRDARARLVEDGKLEPIEPGLFLTMARSTIPSTNVGATTKTRRRTPTRASTAVRNVTPPRSGVAGQVRPPGSSRRL